MSCRMVAARDAAGMLVMMLTTLESRRQAYALAFSAGVSSTHSLIASMASLGPAEDILRRAT